jgi:hypothetical protein
VAVLVRLAHLEEMVSWDYRVSKVTRVHQEHPAQQELLVQQVVLELREQTVVQEHLVVRELQEQMVVQERGEVQELVVHPEVRELLVRLEVRVLQVHQEPLAHLEVLVPVEVLGHLVVME